MIHIKIAYVTNVRSIHFSVTNMIFMTAKLQKVGCVGI